MVSIINSKIKARKIWVSLPNVTSGADLGENHIKLLKRPEIIGVILFSDNLDKSHVNHPKEAFLSIKNLIKSIKKINNNLILSIDHEGGLIYRFNCIFRPPAAKFFGNLYKKDKKLALNQCERASYLAGLDLKKLGIDVCFSPVCDIHDSSSQVIGAKLRAFSDNISIICDLSIAWLKGLNKAGIIGSLKHFPGHGRCELDSHIDYPIDQRSRSQWQDDLNLYKNLFKKLDNIKLNNIKFNNLKLNYGVMLGHMLVPGLDANRLNKSNNSGYSPVYSKNIIKNLLKNELGFNGVVISDCLSMRAADLDLDLECKNNNLSNKINRAHNAGCDWIIASSFDVNEMLEVFSVGD